jgi:hypothetical protein
MGGTVFPELSARPIGDIRSHELLRVLKQIELKDLRYTARHWVARHSHWGSIARRSRRTDFAGNVRTILPRA